VEDDRLLAENIRQSLEKEGLMIAGVAGNLKSAVEIMKQKTVDLVLLDIQLDGPEDGIQTAIELMKIKWVPIIYMTGNTPLEIIDRIQNTFPAAFLEKPLRMRELYIQIELALINFNAGNLPSPSRIESEYIFLPANKGLIGVRVQEILFIKADRVNSQLFLSASEFERLYPTRKYGPVLISVHKGGIIPKLPFNFHSLSRSLVINLNQIQQIDSNSLFIHKHEIPIPDGKRKSLMNQLVIIKNT
jgi:DNA-binding response OmpR family regulator